MKSYVKSIQLKNWFNFLGDYAENTFEFESGFNIIVAANDVGKTKLHNAFRWILEDKVILRKEDYQDDEAAYEVVSLNGKNIINVLNKKLYKAASLNETNRLGVKLCYVENGNQSRERILTKEIQVRKEPDGLKILTELKSVKKVERGNVLNTSESFEDWIKKIIPKNLRSFFLVQGETLDTMTPLRGENLKRTLTKFIDINILNRFLDTSNYASKKIQTLRQDFESEDTRGQQELLKQVKEKKDLETEIEEKKGISQEYYGLKEEAHKKMSRWEKSFLKSKENRKLKEKLDIYDRQIQNENSKIEENFITLKENYILNEFYFSKLFTTTTQKEKLNNSVNFFKDIMSKRRSEIQKNLNENIQTMLYTLEKSQPKPEILERMIDEGKCYVCSQNLDNESKDYMKNILIPYFKGQLENQNDKFIDLYDEIHSLLNNLKYHQNKYEYSSTNPLDRIIERIDKNETVKEKIEEEKDQFIDENGTSKTGTNEELSISTYEEAAKDFNKYNSLFEEFNNELENNKVKLKELGNLKTKTGQDLEESKNTLKAKKLERFSSDIENILVSIIDEEYEQFKSKLENLANKNFKKLTAANKNLNAQSVKIEYKLDYNNQPDFEIKIIDQFGNNMNDGGGASQTLRQLALVFGLIDMIDRVRYSFIADAPTSNMTPNLAFIFYKNQLNSAPNQNIVMTKELWDDQKNDLNSKGIELLDNVNNNQGSTFHIMTAEKKIALDQPDLKIDKL